MQLGTARFTRECPVCTELIHLGDRITVGWVGGCYTWVHLECRLLWRFYRETRRLDDEFRAVAVGPE